MSVEDVIEADRELVIRSREGDRSAFEELVGRHFGSAYAVAYARLRHREGAEEVAQEAVLTAFLHLDKLRDGERFGAWVCGMARNLALKWIRTGERRSRLLREVSWEEFEGEGSAGAGTEAGVVESMQAEQEAGMLRSAMEKLPAEQREAVLLHYGEELTKKEVAERMGVHPATAGRLLERALGNLRTELEGELRAAAKEAAPRAEARRRVLAAVAAAAALGAGPREALAAGAASGGALKGAAGWGAKWPLAALAAVMTAGALWLLWAEPAKRDRGGRARATGSAAGIGAVMATAGAGKERNAYPLMEELFGTSMTLEERHRRLPELLGCDRYEHPISEEQFMKDASDPAKAALVSRRTTEMMDSWLRYRVGVRVARVQVVRELMAGRRDEATSLAASIFWAGELMTHGNLTIARGVGGALAETGLDCLELVFGDGCETWNDIERHWPVVAALDGGRRPAGKLETYKVGFSSWNPFHLAIVKPALDRIVVSRRRIDAGWELLKLGTAARHRRLVSGAWPVREGDLWPLLREAPEDPFTDGAVKWKVVGNELVVWSAGPDGKDNGGQGDDVVLRIPEGRRYPFPAAGTEGMSAEGIRKQFPRGLPEDPWTGKPLRLMEGEGGVGRVVSVVGESGTTGTSARAAGKGGGAGTGPGAEEPLPPYDPTNGVGSTGVLSW